MAPNGAGDDAHTEDDHGKSGKIEEGAQQEEGEFAQARGDEVRQEGQEKGQCPQVGGAQGDAQGNAQDGRQEGAPQSDGEEGLSQRRSEEIGAQGCCQAQGPGPQGQGKGKGEGARKACRGAQTRRSETGCCADASASPGASSTTGGTGAELDWADGHVTQQLLNAAGLFHQG